MSLLEENRKEETYLLDTSAFIAPFNCSKLKALSLALRKNPDDMKQYLKDWFSSGFANGRLLLCPEVKQEIKAEAAALLKSMHYHIVELDDEQALDEVRDFVENHFEEHHAKAFLGPTAADPYLVAIAKAHGYAIVTEEKHGLLDVNESGKISGRARLPYVAFALGVVCVPLMTVLSRHPEW